MLSWNRKRLFKTINGPPKRLPNSPECDASCTSYLIARSEIKAVAISGKGEDRKMPLYKTGKTKERRKFAPGLISPEGVQRKDTNREQSQASSSNDNILQCAVREHSEGQQQRETQEGAHTPAKSSSGGDIKGKGRQSKDGQQPGSREQTAVGNFELVERPRQSSFQEWVEAYMHNQYIEYMAKRNFISRYWERTTATSILNEGRGQQVQREVLKEYNKRVDQIYEETSLIIDKRYEKKINDLNTRLKVCESELKEWQDKGDDLLKELLREDTSSKRDTLKDNIKMVNERIEKQIEELEKLNSSKDKLLDRAQQEFSNLYDSKVGVLNKALDGVQRLLLVELKYQQKQRQWTFGKSFVSTKGLLRVERFL
jgi:hypothetical protein